MSSNIIATRKLDRFMNTSLEHYFAAECENKDAKCRLHNWPTEKAALRQILLESPLQETLKWGVPCYTYEQHNIILMSAFKDYCALSFFKGILLRDRQQLLVKSGKNTHAIRMMRFANLEEITAQQQLIKTYVAEAIVIEKSGLEVKKKETKAYTTPDELKAKFEEMPDFKTAFEALTPGRQRGYLLHFSAAKQSKTRTTRIEKYRPQIMDGKGIRDCTCGRSKKMPVCDGSHQFV